jgi:alpha-N-arabinofuranosidase
MNCFFQTFSGRLPLGLAQFFLPRRLSGILIVVGLVAPLHAQITIDTPIPTIASIRVDTGRAGNIIPGTIFGTFLEPIGNSTYNGLWAELLRNPSLEAGLWSAGNVRVMLEEQPELVRASDLGLPLPWEPVDQTEGNRYEIRYGDAANSNASIEMIGLPDKPVGIKQRVYLPATRELEYTGSLYAKRVADPVTLHLSIRKRNQPEHILANADLVISSDTWTKYSFKFNLAAGDLERLEPADFVVELRDASSVLIDQLSLMPADNLDGLDPEMVQKVRDLHTPLIRFGGNFTSGYHWKDGVGPRDKRVSMLNVAWGIPELNTFGTDEFLHFCDLVGARPQIALNLGSGTPEEAADWVRYVDDDTTWKGHGSGQIWELGNELWGTWNTGWPTLAQLAPRTAAFSKAILAVDPSAQLIATGQDPDNYTAWNAAQLTNPPGTMKYLSSHFVVTTDELRWKNATDDFRAMSGFALPVELERRFNAMTTQIDSTPNRNDVKIAFTEWLWVGRSFDFDKQNNLGRPTPLYDNFAGALTTAGTFNMLLRSGSHVPISDMTGVIEFAGIWKRRGQVYGTPASYVFSMFSGAPADHLLSASVESGEYSVHNGVTRMPDIPHVPFLDVTATASKNGKTVTLFVVNRSLSQDITTDISLPGAKKQQAEAVTMQSGNLFARNSEEHPDTLVPEKTSFAANEKFRYRFPQSSVTRLTIELAR